MFDKTILPCGHVRAKRRRKEETRASGPVLGPSSRTGPHSALHAPFANFKFYMCVLSLSDYFEPDCMSACLPVHRSPYVCTCTSGFFKYYEAPPSFHESITGESLILQATSW
jgi:hypothetical protein